MDEMLHLEVLTPEKSKLDQHVDSVYLQGSEGRLGILPQHTALIAKLDFGELEFEKGGKRTKLLCGDGVVEVQDDHVRVLVRSAELRGDIDVERAKRSLERAKSRRDSNDKEIDVGRAEYSALRALNRLRFLEEL